MSIEKKPNKLVVNILLTSIRIFLKSRSNIVIEHNDTIKMKPPYIILSNHVNNWDPFFINNFVNEPICFIAAESLFRNSFLKKLLNYIGVIPKTKFKSDIRTIRGILKAKRSNRVIGLFPEGNSSWDGHVEPITYATAKLVKLLNIPVVIGNIAGGHLSHPRWAYRHRKGLISISLIKKWDKEDLHNKSIKFIYQKLTEALSYDEMEWQSKRNTSYKGKELANYLERFLFICPHCKIPGQLRSGGNMFKCHNCNYTVCYTALGTLKQINYPIHFSTTHDWNKWQLRLLEETILDSDWKFIWNSVMQEHVKLFVSDKDNSFKIVSTGELLWDHKSIIFQGDDMSQYIFSFDDIERLNIHIYNNLDFFYMDKLYRIKFYNPRTSAYKWLKAIETVQRLYSNQALED
ncbi:1-acyl-sn-glycerol-3-phosphate acyltransferase [Schnuerera sp. xch1]|uniref:1-acyl-sn-glycerol-3-phosphate acyltransferase n=1 Tax=Schnuerera sp. xch1 TaxID=2874283 RepID=UPI001CBE0E78|nr:1-acyl-sn-glycerol-3-phosphate acyltransferase [Schnuerera sp. xch1]MBZ2174240.1 1-acyl-sn-glycerol-3-phosphate acyltransferase [Schnuerera sp. xch1]